MTASGGRFFTARATTPICVVALFLVGVYATFGGLPSTKKTLSQAEVVAVIRDADPVITAIRACETATGHPPATLDALVPRYLSDRPRLSGNRVSGRDYLYTVESNQWRLAIPTHGEKNAVLSYSSIGDYPSGKPSAPVERIGAWAYYHGNPYSP